MRHKAILEQREPKRTISQRYSKEELAKLGNKDHTVQGMEQMLDINKLVKKITPEMVKALREKQMNGNYGIQQNDTIREVLSKTHALKKDFATLPALVREHFKNDELEFDRYITENRNDKYALANLAKDIMKSPKYDLALKELKKKDQEQQSQIEEENKKLKDLIKSAIQPDTNPAT